jgi:flagella basal body P-ring formation protein FlgA
MRAVVIAFSLAATLISSSALAGQPVTLRSELVDGNGQVTLSDLFDNTGSAGNVLVANGVEPGRNQVLDATQVQRLAQRYGLDWSNSTGLRRLIVRSGLEAAPMPASASPASTRPAATVRSASAAMTEVLTYSRSLSSGDVIQAEDLTYSSVLVQAVPNDAPRNADEVIGMGVKRPLRIGQAVSARDLLAPLVIRRDDLVQVVYRDGSIVLSLEAKAMGNAAVGELFTLQNTSSKKSIEAVATGPGKALTGPEAAQVRREPTSRRLAFAQ